MIEVNVGKKEASKTDNFGLAGKRKRRFRRELNDAIDEGIKPIINVMPPRSYVALMTMSGVEIGRALKRALRDEMYEERRKATPSK